MTSDSGHWTWYQTSHTYSSDGCKYQATNTSGQLNNRNTCDVVLPSDFEVEMTYMGGRNYTLEAIVGGAGWTYDVANQRSWGYYRTSSSSGSDQHDQIINGAINVGDVFKFKRQNGTLYIYQNDVLKWSYTPSSQNNELVLQTFQGGRYSIIKDIKVKSL